MGYEIISHDDGWFVALETGHAVGPFTSQLQADVEGGIIALQMANVAEPLSFAELQGLAAECGTQCRTTRLDQAAS